MRASVEPEAAPCQMVDFLLVVGADREQAVATAVEGIAQVWENFRAEQVYRADSLGVIRSGAQWLTMLSIGWLIARWLASSVPEAEGSIPVTS